MIYKFSFGVCCLLFWWLCESDQVKAQDEKYQSDGIKFLGVSLHSHTYGPSEEEMLSGVRVIPSMDAISLLGLNLS